MNVGFEPWELTAEPYSACLFIFLKNCLFSESDHTGLHSHQQLVSVQVSPFLNQHLFFYIIYFCSGYPSGCESHRELIINFIFFVLFFETVFFCVVF